MRPLRQSEAITQEDFHTPFMDLHMASMEFTRVINLLGGMLRGGELSPTLLFENDTLDELQLVCALKLRCDSVCLPQGYTSVLTSLGCQPFPIISAQTELAYGDPMARFVSIAFAPVCISSVHLKFMSPNRHLNRTLKPPRRLNSLFLCGHVNSSC